MFSGELPNLRDSWVSQRREVLIGTLTGVVATTLLVSSRLAPFFLVALVALWVWARWKEIDLRAALPETDGLTLSLGALLLYALASTLWAAHPGAGIDKVLLMAAVTFVSQATARLVAKESRPGILCASEGLWLGLLIGLVFFLVEGLTGEGIKIFVINTLHVSPELLQPERSYHWTDGRLVKIDHASFTRSATPISLLVWPALMAALGAIARPWNSLTAVLILVCAAAAIFLSPQESSKTAIVIGLGALALAWYSSLWAWRLIAAMWVVACLAVVPAALLAHRLDLHNAPWLQRSAQHRIIIWNFTAEEALKAPIFGIGAYMTYVMGPEISARTVNEPGERLERKLSRHAHNAYLQTWFELGAVGALLLMAAGLQILGRIRGLAPTVAPFAFATFSSAATLLASSYGIWQSWYISLFGIATILFAVGASAFDKRGGVPMAETSP